MPAVCWLPPSVVVPITFPLRSAYDFNSGRLTSQNTGRRRPNVNTLIGAPRGIARMALPIEPSALTSPEMIAAIAAVARPGRAAHRVLRREKTRALAL